MTRALWLLAALPLAAQHVSSGLDQEFRRLVAATAQPQWIGFKIPASRTAGMGCNSVPGVVHLEPPEQVAVLFRAERNVIDQIRSISTNCEIDAAGVPVHWLTGVQPAESAALLATYAADPDQRLQRQAISALTMVSEGVPALIQLAKTAPTVALQRQAMNSLQQSRDPRALQFFEDVLKH